MKKLLIVLFFLIALAGCSQITKEEARDSRYKRIFIEDCNMQDSIDVRNECLLWHISSSKLSSDDINIKELCIDAIIERPRNHDINIIDDMDANCNNIGCTSLFYDFYSNLSETDDHDPNNYCQGLSDIYEFLSHNKLPLGPDLSSPH